MNVIAPMQHDRNSGYGFLSKIFDENKKFLGYHPGVDLNKGPGAKADEGLPVVAPCDGEVVYARNGGRGWGNLIVIHAPQLGRYSRHAHFQRIDVRINQRVSMGQQIGLCGHTGTTSPHHHWEILRKRLDHWAQYVYGWSKSKVKEYFEDPFDFLISKNMNMESVISNWAKPSVEKAKKSKIIEQWPHPQGYVDAESLAWVFYKLKVKDKAPTAPLTWEEFAVCFDKLGLFDKQAIL